MFDVATPVRARNVSPGLRWALAAVAFLAFLAAFIALNLPSGDMSKIDGSTVVVTRLHDYGLRHPPIQETPSLGVSGRWHDFALRHVPEQLGSRNDSVDARLRDYALRHVPVGASFSNSPDYALRHPAG